MSDRHKALLSPYSSRLNKLHLCISWGIEWRWQGEAENSRVEVLLDGHWRACKSYEDDIKPTLELNRPRKSTPVLTETPL